MSKDQKHSLNTFVHKVLVRRLVIAGVTIAFVLGLIAFFNERNKVSEIVTDEENDTEYAIVEFEFGWIMSKWTDLKGQSIYIRQSVGVGTDRPTEGSIEVGYKIFGW